MGLGLGLDLNFEVQVRDGMGLELGLDLNFEVQNHCPNAKFDCLRLYLTKVLAESKIRL